MPAFHAIWEIPEIRGEIAFLLRENGGSLRLQTAAFASIMNAEPLFWGSERIEKGKPE